MSGFLSLRRILGEGAGFIVVLALSGGLATPASATDYQWISSAPNMWWTNSGAWSPGGGPPGAADIARFINLGGNGDILLPASALEARQLIIQNADVTLTWPYDGQGVGQYGTLSLLSTEPVAPSLLMGTASGNTASLRLNNYAGTLYSQTAMIGFASGSEATVTVAQGAYWQAFGNVSIGRQGEGTLEVIRAIPPYPAPYTKMIAYADLTLGALAGSSGTATVGGEGSSITVKGTLRIADGGAGQATIDADGALYTNGGTFVGPDSLAGGHGDLTISGANADWTAQNDSAVHQPVDVRHGTVTITNQGRAATGNVEIGTDNSSGLVVVDGSVWPGPIGLRARWDVNGNVDVGPTATTGFGQGRLFVQDAGWMVATGDLDVHSAEAVSAVTVQANGELEIGGTLTIGPHAQLNLHDSGSHIATGHLTRTGSGGVFNWTAGTLEVTAEGCNIDSVNPHPVFGSALTIGAGKKLHYSDPAHWFNVGFEHGSGALEIIDGGRLEVGHLYVGNRIDGEGTVAVTGDGSRIDTSTNFGVGVRGTTFGRLEVLDQASIHVPMGSAGMFNAAEGEILIDAAELWCDGTFTVGGVDGAQGTVDVLQGGLFSVGQLYASMNNAAIGTLSVANPGSEIRISDWAYLGLGPDGAGTLTASDHAAVMVGGSLHIEANGAVALASGATLTADRLVRSTGTFVDAADTTVRVNGLVGFNTTFHGTLQVGHAGGSAYGSYILTSGQTLEVGAHFDIGYNAGGTVNSPNQVQVDVGHTTWLGTESTGFGELAIWGPSTVWTNGHDLVVGQHGSGNFYIHSGATMQCEDGYVALEVGSSGVAAVESGANWHASAGLHVGQRDYGELSIHQGGTVQSEHASIGWFGGASGWVDVQGDESHWTNETWLAVGGSETSSGGFGTLLVRDGGRLTNDHVLRVWPDGTVRLLAGGLIETDTFAVAGGTLETEPDSVLRVNQLLDHGPTPLFHGHLEIGLAMGPTIGNHTVGGGESLTVGQDLTIGSDYMGTLLATDGGEVITGGHGYAGRFTGYGGTEVAVGPLSVWSIGEVLWIGGGNDFEGPGHSAVVFVDEGALVVTGGDVHLWQPGTLHLAGGELHVNTDYGDVGVNIDGGEVSGFGIIHGSLTNNGLVSPGGEPEMPTTGITSPTAGPIGVIELHGLYVQDTPGLYRAHLDGVLPPEHDRVIVVDGMAVLAGQIHPEPLHFALPWYEPMSVLHVDGPQGPTASSGGPAAVQDHFQTVAGVKVIPGKALAVTYGPNDVFVTVALPADANLDRTVDVIDLGRLGLHFDQSPAIWSDGDFNGDGVVDVVDLGTLGLSFGQSVPISDQPFLIPEPASLALLLLGGLAMRRRRPHRPGRPL